METGKRNAVVRKQTRYDRLLDYVKGEALILASVRLVSGFDSPFGVISPSRSASVTRLVSLVARDFPPTFGPSIAPLTGDRVLVLALPFLL